MVVAASDFQFPDYLLHKKNRSFPGGPVVKNPPCSAADTGLIPGQGTNIAHASETKPECQNYWACTPQLESLCVATKTQFSQINKEEKMDPYSEESLWLGFCDMQPIQL